MIDPYSTVPVVQLNTTVRTLTYHHTTTYSTTYSTPWYLVPVPYDDCQHLSDQQATHKNQW